MKTTEQLHNVLQLFVRLLSRLFPQKLLTMESSCNLHFTLIILLQITHSAEPQLVQKPMQSIQLPFGFHYFPAICLSS